MAAISVATLAGKEAASRKPKRGREFGTRTRQSKAELTKDLYHEGIIDDKVFLVPDSTLEAMKDMVNLTMRPRRSLRYKHETSTDIQDPLSSENIDRLLGKLDDFCLYILGNNSESGGTVISKNDNNESEVMQTGKEDDIRSEELLNVELLTETTSHKEKKGKKKRKHERKSEPELERSKTVSLEDESLEVNEHRIRILISGHFKNDNIPIYIIQNCNSRQCVFKNQSVDITSSQREGDVIVSVNGKLYDKNILDEFEGRPVSLNIKPYKIPIQNERKIFVGSFEHTLETSTADITLSGQFKRKSEVNFTPSLTIVVKQRNVHPSAVSDCG